MLLGTFEDRPNRFVARIRMEDGSLRLVHVASSGRMKELLVPGAPVAVRESASPTGKTDGVLALAQHQGTWVSVDTALPGRLLRAAFPEGAVPGFEGYTEVRPEYTYGDSRLDFLLRGEGLPPCLVEVKSVTSALPDPDGVLVARFPDAPTERGAKHLRELVKAREDGYRACVCFIAQRDDVGALGPWDSIDPAFGQALRVAAHAGVEVHAFMTHCHPDKIFLAGPLPIRF